MCSGDIVGDAMEGDTFGRRVVDGEGGAPVAIARLTDGTRIDEMARSDGYINRELFRLIR